MLMAREAVVMCVVNECGNGGSGGVMVVVVVVCRRLMG